MVQILSLEYQTLRSEILTLTSGRYQFFGLMTAAAALLASGVGHSISSNERWIIGFVALTIFVVGLAYFLRLGRNIATLSARIASIEGRINDLTYSQSKLLSWESEQQQRSLLKRITLGWPSRT
jgi:hypothetical protein